MRKRTIARIMILNALFQVEVGGVNYNDALENALYSIDDEVIEGIFGKKQKSFLLKEKVKIQQYIEDPDFRDFVNEVFSGVLRHSKEFDRKIEEKLLHWKFDRVGKVEKNIIKIALYEMLYKDDIPPSVSIDEAVQIAKIFCEPDTGRFVNGILGAIYEGALNSDELKEKA